MIWYEQGNYCQYKRWAIDEWSLLFGKNSLAWEIEDEIVYPDLGRDEKGFSLEAYTNSDKDILLSSKYKYMEAFMVSENLKDKILENFSLPFLYSLEEWKELNNLDSYWD